MLLYYIYLGWSKDLGPPNDGELPRHFFLGRQLGKKILSVFIDESGDFGKYEPHSPNYYVAMVLHDQSTDISESIKSLNEHIKNFDLNFDVFHTGPLIRREEVYKYEQMEKRRSIFNSLFHFARKLPVLYLCPKINKAECEDNEVAYIAKLSKSISDELKKNYDYFNSFDLIVNYYDNGQIELTKILTSVFTTLFSNVEMRKVEPVDYKLFQVADLICTLELVADKVERNSMTKSERDFFGSEKEFVKNIYKYIRKKKL